MSAKAQMQWTLTENESNTTLEAWIDKLICILSQEEIFTPFLRPDATWGKKTRKSPFRGFTGPDAANSSAILELMLLRIATCAPAVFYHTIVKNSTSLESIWQAMKRYYGIDESNKSAACLFHSNAQYHNCCQPSYQDYPCMSDRQPNCDQYSSEDTKACSVKITEPEIQSYTVDIVIYHADDDSDLRDDTTPALVEDDYNVTPDSFDVISLNDPASQVSKEVWQSFPSHQNLSDLSPQNMYSSNCSSTPMFKHSSQDSEQSSSMPTARGKIYFDKDSQDREDNPGIELVQKYLPDQGTFQTYNDIKDEGQCAPPLPQKVQQCSSAPVEDLTDKVVLLKSVQDSPVKATTCTEPTEESIKIPPDPTDENLTTTACTSFHEPLPVPSIQAVDGLPLHRTGYQFLSNSFVCEFSEPDPCYPPDKFSLHPSQLKFPEDDPAKIPQQPFLSSAVSLSSSVAVPLSPSDRQVDQVSASSIDTTRDSETFLGILDESSIHVDLDSHDLHHEVLSTPKNTVKQESKLTVRDAENQTTESFGDVSLRPIEKESIEPIAKDVPKPDNDNLSAKPEHHKEECISPKEVCNTDWDPTEETELPCCEFEDAWDRVAVPIPSGTLKPEKQNIVAPVPVLTTDHSHEPESELSETIAIYKPPGQEPHPDNDDILVPSRELPATPDGRPMDQVKEVPAQLVQEAFPKQLMPVKSYDIPLRKLQDSELSIHPFVDTTFLECTTPPRPSDVLWTDSGGYVKYIGSNSTAYTGRIWMLCLAGFINDRLPKHNTPLCPCETVTVGVG